MFAFNVGSAGAYAPVGTAPLRNVPRGDGATEKRIQRRLHRSLRPRGPMVNPLFDFL